MVDKPTPSLAGKFILVTGASSGIGFVTARARAARGAGLVMVCRDPVRGETARLAVARAATGAPPLLLGADLSSLAGVATLANEVRRYVPRLDVLINNAAGMFARRELTIDGNEKTFATNYLAPFLLTNLLLDPLRAAPQARIVMVAATGPGSLDFDNLQGERRYNFLSAYFRSKLALIVFTFELARRLAGTGITANCMSPGPTRTRFGDDMRGLPRLFPLIMKRLPLLFVSPETGAAGVIDLAAAAERAGVTERFFLRRREATTKPIARDREVAARLWRASEALCASWLQSAAHRAP